MKLLKASVALWGAGLMMSTAANATLIDRGGGLIYDDVLNVTWLQDASYAVTSGYSDSGNLTWGQAQTWASSLVYVDSNTGIAYDDWRLPSTINSASSLGYDPTGMSSELAYMYYVNLGYAANETHNRYDPAPTSTNYNPFINLIYRSYWSETLTDNPNRAYLLHFHFGSVESTALNDGLKVWAVRDGDVQPYGVPEPGTLGLLSLGILGAATMKRRRGNQR